MPSTPNFHLPAHSSSFWETSIHQSFEEESHLFLRDEILQPECFRGIFLQVFLITTVMPSDGSGVFLIFINFFFFSF